MHLTEVTTWFFVFTFNTYLSDWLQFQILKRLPGIRDISEYFRSVQYVYCAQTSMVIYSPGTRELTQCKQIRGKLIVLWLSCLLGFVCRRNNCTVHNRKFASTNITVYLKNIVQSSIHFTWTKKSSQSPRLNYGSNNHCVVGQEGLEAKTSPLPLVPSPLSLVLYSFIPCPLSLIAIPYS